MMDLKQCSGVYIKVLQDFHCTILQLFVGESDFEGVDAGLSIDLLGLFTCSGVLELVVGNLGFDKF